MSRYRMSDLTAREDALHEDRGGKEAQAAADAYSSDEGDSLDAVYHPVPG